MIGKLEFSGSAEGFCNLIDKNGFSLLPVSKAHIFELEKLSFIHRDPFDRILVAAAISERMVVITTDTNIKLYPISCVW
jgi:PIN domain nuclease of toxin-antitoxin system